MKSRLAHAFELLFEPREHSLPDDGSAPEVGSTAIDTGQLGNPKPMLSLIANERTAACDLANSVNSSLGTKLLPGVLSVIAGSVDVISFLGLGGLFTAHITGNLVVLAAHIVTGRAMPLGPILAVPVFIAVLGLTRAGGRQSEGHPPPHAAAPASAAIGPAREFSGGRRRGGSPPRSCCADRRCGGHARRRRDGRAERPRADLIGRGTGDRGDDDRHHETHDGSRRDTVSARF